MLGLTILKRVYNLSDERIVEEWVKNPYYQYFCGEAFFQWKVPCDPTDLVYFRKRIGKEGVEKLCAISISLHGKDGRGQKIRYFHQIYYPQVYEWYQFRVAIERLSNT